MDVKPEFLERIKSLAIDELHALKKVATNKKLDAVTDELQNRKDAASAEESARSERMIETARVKDRTTAVHIAIFATLSAIFIALNMIALHPNLAVKRDGAKARRPLLLR